VLAHRPGPGHGQALAQVRLFRQAADHAGQVAGIAGRDGDQVFPRREVLADGRRLGGDQRLAQRQALQDAVRHHIIGLGAPGENTQADVGPRHHRDQVVQGWRLDEVQALDAQQVGALDGGGVARPAPDHLEAKALVGVEPAQRPQDHLRAVKGVEVAVELHQ